MTIDPSWTSTIASIQANAALSPAKAEHQFGFLLSALGVKTTREAEALGSEYRLDPILSRNAVSFAAETDAFLANLAQTDQNQAAWNFLDYMRRSELFNDPANAPLFDVLGQKIGLDESQRIEMKQSLRLEQSLVVLPYLQVDLVIRIYGLPPTANVTAISTDPSDKTKITRTTGFVEIGVYGAKNGDIFVSQTYDENNKITYGFSAHWTISTDGKKYATFHNQFGFKPKIPIGSFVDKYGDIHLVRGERLALARSAYGWALDNPSIYTNLTGVRSGNALNIENLIDEYNDYYLVPLARKLKVNYYNRLEAAYDTHIRKKAPWTLKTIQDVFQSAIKLSSLLTSEISDMKLSFSDQPNPNGRSEEYTAGVTDVLNRYVDNADAKKIVEVLVSARLDNKFQLLLKQAKDLSRTTAQNAALAIATFDPHAAAAVTDLELIKRGLPNVRAFLPNAKKTDDPNTYVNYLMRRLLTQKIATSIDPKAVKRAAIGAAYVYLFGIFREIVPAVKYYVITPETDMKIQNSIESMMSIVGNEMVFTVPRYLGKTYSQDAAGAIERAFAEYKLKLFKLTPEQRYEFGQRLGWLDHTNSWMPLVSLSLRAIQYAQGEKALNWHEKASIIARMVADLMSFAGYLHENPTMIKYFAARLGVAAGVISSKIQSIRNALSAAANIVQPLFMGFRGLNCDFGVQTLAGNYLIAPLVRLLPKVKKLANVAGGLVGEMADIVYGAVNIYLGGIQLARGKLWKGAGLTLYGLINFASGLAFTVFTVRGIATQRYQWATPLRAASFFLQISASVMNGYLLWVSAREADQV